MEAYRLAVPHRQFSRLQQYYYAATLFCEFINMQMRIETHHLAEAEFPGSPGPRSRHG